MDPRRLFTISGVLPVGVFVVAHLVTTSSALFGQSAWGRTLGAFATTPGMTAFELLLILVPLAFHGAYGTMLALRPPAGEARLYGYTPGVRRAQRLSSFVVLAFVLWHFVVLRLPRLLGRASATETLTRVTAELSSTRWGVPWIALATIAGLLATVFHLTAGVFAMRTAAGKRPSTVLAIVVGLLLFLGGTWTTIGIATGSRIATPAASGTSACGQPPLGASRRPDSAP